MVTADHTGIPAPGTADQRLRVVLLLDVLEGQEESFLAAYDQIRHQVAEVPGHLSDQLCQSLGNSSQWLITSEWESAEPFLKWVGSDDHRAVVRPLRGCVAYEQSLRFVVARQTPEPVPPPSGAGLVRRAFAFTVKPGTEDRVARILAGYASPRARVDAATRLCRTSLFMRGNQVVRAVEVEGDLGEALRHVAEQPEVRRAEEAVGSCLEESRDLTDPVSAREFFARAALPAVHHVGGPRALPAARVTRHAFLYPVRPGQAAYVAELLGDQDRAAAADRGSPLVQSTVFAREDLFVRMVDLSRPYREVPVAASGFSPRVAERLLPHLDVGDAGFTADEPALSRFLARCEMSLVTDRAATAS